jgi:uncharacterized protein YndB with AHSA1/START domain
MKQSRVLILAAVVALGRPAPAQEQISHEGIVDASVHDVWKAYTTKEGLESWMVAHADIALEVGGRMRTHYDPKGTLGDPKTIENTILSYEPERMMSMRVSKAPAGFPFPNATKTMWTVVYFEPISPLKTRLREVTLGFGDDDESRRMREFFDRGNAVTLSKLQKHFSEASSGK